MGSESSSSNVTSTNVSIPQTIDLSYCHNQSSPNDYSSDTIVYWLEGVSLTSVGFIGIIGNIMTILVLKKLGKLQSNVFNQLIVIICVFDSLFAGFSILEYGFKKGFKLLTYTSPIYVNIWPKVIYPLHNVTYSVSLFMTLAIAFERYIAVCHPFIIGKDRGLNHTASVRGGRINRPNDRNNPGGLSSHNSAPLVRKRTLYYMVPAISAAVMINVPKFMEFRTVKKMNVTIIEPTELRLDPEYELYYINWARTIINAFLPFVILAFFNGQIIYSIKMSKNISSNRATALNKREANLTRILILMVFCFLFCNLGKFVLNLYDLALGFDRIKACTSNGLMFHPPIWVVTLLSMNHVLLTMNASANLLLFACSGTQFRTTLLAMLHLGRRNSNHRSSPLSMCSRRQNSGIELDELTCISQNASGRSYRFVKLLSRNTLSRVSSGTTRRAEMASNKSEVADGEDDKAVVVFHVGLNPEPKNQTTFL